MLIFVSKDCGFWPASIRPTSSHFLPVKIKCYSEEMKCNHHPGFVPFQMGKFVRTTTLFTCLDGPNRGWKHKSKKYLKDVVKRSGVLSHNPLAPFSPHFLDGKSSGVRSKFLLKKTSILLQVRYVRSHNIHAVEVSAENLDSNTTYAKRFKKQEKLLKKYLRGCVQCCLEEGSGCLFQKIQISRENYNVSSQKTFVSRKNKKMNLIVPTFPASA